MLHAKPTFESEAKSFTSAGITVMITVAGMQYMYMYMYLNMEDTNRQP